MLRRRFIQTTSGIAAAGLVSSLARPLWAFPQESIYKETIGLQLWTVRNQIKKNKKKTLKAVADAGYKQVELIDVIDAKEQLPICKDLGLQVTSAFMNWEAICKPKSRKIPTLESIAEAAAAAELKHLVFGYIGKGYREKADQYKSYAETANEFGELLKKSDIQLCYHNHSFEFAKIEGEKTGYDFLIEHLDNEKCKFELDVFWAKIGGWDPIETMDTLAGRISQVHLKDLKKDTPVIYNEGKVPKNAFKELGNGSIDLVKILAKAEEIDVEQCHVEQDHSPDPIASVGQSIKYFNSISE